ncbi:MAG: hypothetical protein KJ887_07250 [Candidatus Omnitrophica bacterium]|nr:hypothetical protein [Candidatus Omnitrophota bacterium]MBU1048364.1 hypothetical protein [Candidatus Omnitrophota bacterium]MBU1767842.1 hypothetical protein [Candidatus Omnitrophota bacterium]
MPVITNEEVHVSTADRDENGKQIDAEERPAELRMETAIPVSVGQQANVVGALGNGSGVTLEGNALTFASGMAHQCYLCAHFDQRAFRRWKERMELSPDLEDRKQVNFLRAEVLGSGSAALGPDGDIDVEGELMSEFGLCRAIPEIVGDTIIVMKNSGCPTYPGPKGEDLTKCFKPKDRESLTESDNIRDSILTTAQGQVRRRTTRVPLTIFNPKK